MSVESSDHDDAPEEKEVDLTVQRYTVMGIIFSAFTVPDGVDKVIWMAGCMFAGFILGMLRKSAKKNKVDSDV